MQAGGAVEALVEPPRAQTVDEFAACVGRGKHDNTSQGGGRAVIVEVLANENPSE